MANRGEVKRAGRAGSRQVKERRGRLIRLAVAAVVVSACVPLGMTLPYDDAPPAPNGGRLRSSVAWLTTAPEGVNASTVPQGRVSLQPKHIDGRDVWQQVRHLRTAEGEIGDSVLLDRNTLRPIVTWRWTPRGTWITKYNHRQVERTFRGPNGHSVKSVETMDVEPYADLGVELVASALPLHEGYEALIPVVVDSSARGWNWMRISVARELNVAERPDMPQRDTWIVDCDQLGSRMRIWVAVDGRAVRRIEYLSPDDSVRLVLRHMLLTVPKDGDATDR